MGTALDDLAGYLDIRQAGIVACILSAAPGVFRDATGLWCVGGVFRCIPVGGPFPDVADHVVNVVTVRRERGDGRRALEAVFTQVLPRKFTLPGVGLMLAAGREFITPGIFGTADPAARVKFPFGFRRQILASPACICERVWAREED